MWMKKEKRKKREEQLVQSQKGALNKIFKKNIVSDQQENPPQTGVENFLAGRRESLSVM